MPEKMCFSINLKSEKGVLWRAKKVWNQRNLWTLTSLIFYFVYTKHQFLLICNENKEICVANNNNNNNNNSGHLIDALHKQYHSALQKGNKLHYFSCTMYQP